MGKVGGFLEYKRCGAKYRPTRDRVKDWKLVQENFSVDEIREQGARCMECGVPFCSSACPVGNIIPDWNDFVYRGDWQAALERLQSTNSFPEFTGLVCPAPCETGCVLGINDDPVAIKQIEWEIIRHGWDEGFVKPIKPLRRTGRSVAVVGSGPAGLAAAQQLNRAGHTVTLFEKADRVGGLLRYGIPDFKLEKWVIDRRVEQMREEGVQIQTGVNVGVDLSVQELRKNFDAVLLAIGCEQPRDLSVAGRSLQGIHFALEFLQQQNRRCVGDEIAPATEIVATGKKVVVIGGGDTGSDCIGTSVRHGAQSIVSFEIMEKPPETRDPSTPWPLWPRMLRVSSSHKEGGEVEYCVTVKRFLGAADRVQKLHCVRVEWKKDAQGRLNPQEIPNSDFEIEADLVFLAMGFTNPVHTGLVESFGLKLDARGNIAAKEFDFSTSEPGVFVAGDARRGQSLVVWAISEGREAARAVDLYLMGKSSLQSRNCFI